MLFLLLTIAILGNPVALADSGKKRQKKPLQKKKVQTAQAKPESCRRPMAYFGGALIGATAGLAVLATRHHQAGPAQEIHYDIEPEILAEFEEEYASPNLEDVAWKNLDTEAHYVSSFTGLKADKEKFLSLAGLTTKETVSKIRAHGVHIVFIDTSGAHAHKLEKLNNVKLTPRELKALEIDFIDQAGALHTKMGRPLAVAVSSDHQLRTKNGGSILSPLHGKPSIVVDIAALEDSYDFRTTLQHEFLHLLFDHPATRTRAKENQELTQRAEAWLARIEEIKKGGRPKDTAEFIELYAKIQNFNIDAVRLSLVEMDVVSVQINEAKTMGTPLNDLDKLLEYAWNVGNRFRNKLKSIRSDEFIHFAFENPTLTTTKGVKELTKLIRNNNQLLQELLRYNSFTKQPNIEQLKHALRERDRKEALQKLGK